MSSQELRFGLWLACVTLWAHNLSCQATSSPLPHLHRWRNITFLRAPHNIIVVLWIYRVLEKILEHSSVNKTFSQPSDVSYQVFSLTWRPSILCLKHWYFSAEDSWHLTCWIVSFILRFHDSFSSTIITGMFIIGQNRLLSTSWFVFEAFSFQPLVHPKLYLVKRFSNFFEWMTRLL